MLLSGVRRTIFVSKISRVEVADKSTLKLYLKVQYVRIGTLLSHSNCLLPSSD